MDSKDYKTLSIIGILVLTLIFFVHAVVSEDLQTIETKSKLLTAGVTANSVRCAIANEEVACANAAVEDRQYATRMQESIKSAQGDVSTTAP